MERQKRTQKDWYEKKKPADETEIIRISHPAHINRLRELLPVWDVKLCLNCGCGRGGQDKIFGPSVGVDISFENIRSLKRLGGEGVVADMEALPFKEGTFDLVYGFGVLHHLHDIQAGVREAARVLRKGGQIGFGSENNGWCPLNYVVPFLYGNWKIEKGFYRIRDRNLKKVLQKAGIGEVRISKGGMTIYGMGWSVYRVTSIVEKALSRFSLLKAFSGYCYVAGKKNQ
jgi:SAM-dependent methyltransferase